MQQRNASTASTRRDSRPPDGSPSLPKMLKAPFSTARGVIEGWSAWSRSCFLCHKRLRWGPACWPIGGRPLPKGERN